MLRLTRHDPDETPESYPFPREAARFLRGNRYEQIPESPLDRGASAAARRVEEAMRKVESRFKFLRELVEFPDPDRPRAA
jgi:hypothetical protein